MSTILRTVALVGLSGLSVSCGGMSDQSSAPDVPSALPSPAPTPTPTPGPTHSPAPNPPPGFLEWSSVIAATGNEAAFRGAAASGNDAIYVVGTFADAAPFSFNGISVQSNGQLDGFIAKLQLGTGEIDWFLRFGGIGNDLALDVGSDAQGAAYVVGQASGPVQVGGLQIDAGDGDAIIVKVSNAGMVQWARTLAGQGVSAANRIDVASDGTIALAGQYRGQPAFGPGNSLPAPNGASDPFIAMFDSNGTPLWLRQVSATAQDDLGQDVAVAANGRVLATGSFSGTLTTGGRSLSTAGTDVGCYVADFGASGTLTRLTAINGSGSDVCRGIGIDSEGSYRVAGSFSGPLFSGGESLTPLGQSDIFVASFTSVGALQWARAGGGTGLDEAAGLAIDPQGTVSVVVNFNSSFTAGGGNVSARGGRDILLLQYDRSGNIRSLLPAGGSRDEQGLAIAVLPSLLHVILGTFCGGANGPCSAQFGPGTTFANQGAGFLAIARTVQE